jgi:restriction system protein
MESEELPQASGEQSGTDALVRAFSWGPPRTEGGRLVIPLNWGAGRPDPHDDDFLDDSSESSLSESDSEGVGPSPEILVPFAFSVDGSKADDGLIIASVTIAWDALCREIEQDPDFLHRVTPRQLEELVAARYHESGWKVTLTPRSGDGGRDVIAVHEGLKVRVFDEVKRFDPGSRIDAKTVRALFGVLAHSGNVSKGIITTTANFAPGVEREFADEIPYRLELRNGSQLAEWIRSRSSQ